MKIVIAMDSFKGSLSSIQACNAVAQGIKSTVPAAECLILPMSDGGDGLIDVFRENAHYTVKSFTVCGPVQGNLVDANIAFSNDGTTAVIESAQACGLSLLSPDERNPLKTTSYGVGEMMRFAIVHGVKRIILGLGGTSTNDLGTGMLAALGVSFSDDKNDVINQQNGSTVGKIKKISNYDNLNRLFEGIDVTIASDVINPLCGPKGAAQTYARQKGASELDILNLECWAKQFSSIVSNTLNRDFSNAPGAGAAGGLGYALMSFLNCNVESGATLLLNTLGYKECIADADLVITGEGASDEQTLMGKAPSHIMDYAARSGVPVALISGQINDAALLRQAGFKYLIAAKPAGQPLEKALLEDVATRNIVTATAQLFTQISL